MSDLDCVEKPPLANAAVERLVGGKWVHGDATGRLQHGAESFVVEIVDLPIARSHHQGEIGPTVFVYSLQVFPPTARACARTARHPIARR